MIKKRIYTIILIGLLVLVGCSNNGQNVEKENDNPSINNIEDNEDNKDNEKDTKKEDEVENDNIVNDSEKYSRIDYINSVFKEYNYNAPDQSKWIIKEEGPSKIAVIIKENQKNSRPIMTKLIFLEGNTNEILFLEIENNIIIK